MTDIGSCEIRDGGLDVSASMSEDVVSSEGCLDSMIGRNVSGKPGPASERYNRSWASNTARGVSTPGWEKIVGTGVEERRVVRALLIEKATDGCLIGATGLE